MPKEFPALSPYYPGEMFGFALGIWTRENIVVSLQVIFSLSEEGTVYGSGSQLVTCDPFMDRISDTLHIKYVHYYS